MSKNIEKISALIIIIATLVVLLGNFPNIFANTIIIRQTAIIFSALILVFLFSLKVLKEKEGVNLYLSPIAITSLIYPIVAIASSLNSKGLFNSLIISLTAIACSLLIIIIPQLIRSKKVIKIVLLFIFLTISLGSAAPLIPKDFNYPQAISIYLKSVTMNWTISPNLTGINYITFMLYVAFFPISCFLVYSTTKTKKIIASTSILIIILISLSIIISFAFPLKNNPDTPTILPNTIALKIAQDTISKSPLLGTGPGNFAISYALNKPLFSQNNSYDSLNFNHYQNSSNEYLHVITTSGFLGISSYLLFFAISLFFLLFTSIKNKDALGISMSISILLSIIIQAFTPIPLSVYYLTVIIISLAQIIIYNKPNLRIIKTEKEESPITIIFSVISTSLLIVFFYISYRVIYAEYHQRLALNNASIKSAEMSVKLNPINDNYRTLKAQIALKNSNEIFSQKAPKLKDDEKNKAIELIQSAISETKEAISLNPDKSYNYQLLGQIYALLAKSLPDAATFSIESYNKAIEKDPTNPLLRIEIGGIYYSKGDFALARDHYQEAVNLQNNYPNAHYNLGQALLRTGAYDEGIKELSTTTSLLPDNSPDKEKIEVEIESIKKQLITAKDKSK